MTGEIIHVQGEPMRVESEVHVRYPVEETAEQRAKRVALGLPQPMWGYVAVRVAIMEMGD